MHRTSSKSTGFTRQRRGCLTCRKRKKKCSQTYPVCGHCSRLNLSCQWEEPRNVHLVDGSARPDPESQISVPRHDNGSDVFRLAQLHQPLALFPSHDSISDGALDLTSSRRMMMRYFTTTLAFMLTTNVENNCFLSVLLPMAFECPALMYALAASSSAHIALRDQEFKDVSLQHRCQALSNLKSSMDQGTISNEMCLAVTMVLCSMESISEATESWIHHLSGAAATLQPGHTGADPTISLRNTFEGKWLLRNFAYHDVLMSVSLDRRPFLSGDYWISEDDSLADPYFGFASRVLYLLGEVSKLNADLADREQEAHYADASESYVLGQSKGSDDSEAELSQLARKLESELRAWVCPTDLIDSPLACLGEGYRSAALIHLYRTLRRYVQGYQETLDQKMASCVQSICLAARRMPEGCLPECTLLFPLFMAGGEAEDSADMEFIRERLCTMNRWRKFRNVEACVEVLDEVWRLRSAGTRKEDDARVDWLDILKYRDWKLAIS